MVYVHEREREEARCQDRGSLKFKFMLKSISFQSLHQGYNLCKEGPLHPTVTKRDILLSKCHSSSLLSHYFPPGPVQKTMQSSGHRFRDVEHHPLLAENDSYDSSSSEADMADRVWFIRDGCGMVCAVMTWLLVVYADFVVTFVMLLPSKDFWYSLINGVLFNCLAVLALSSHLRTMLTDPVSRGLSRCITLLFGAC